MAKRFFIPLTLFIEAEQFNSLLPPAQWPEGITTDASSPTGFTLTETRSTYVEEKPEGMAETKTIKHPIESGDYISRKNNRVIIHSRINFEEKYKELITP